MDQIGIVKRAARLVWQFRGLWLIGAILALVSGSGGGVSGSNYRFGDGRGGSGGLPFTGFPNLPRIDGGTAIALLLTIGCLVFLVAIVFSVVRYVLTAGLFVSVDELEGRGATPTLGQAWRAGWNRRTWRLFLQDLVVGIPLAIVIGILVVIAVVPFVTIASRNGGLQALGIIAGILMLVIVFALIVVVALVVSLLSQIWYREAILADRGVIASIESAYHLVRGQLRDLGAMWLLMLGIGIAWTIVMIPVILIILVLAAAIGGIPAYALYAATHSIALAVLVGLPLFLVVLAVPIMVIGGYYTAFQSTAWTLAYRQATGRVVPAQPIVPAPAAPAATAAP